MTSHCSRNAIISEHRIASIVRSVLKEHYETKEDFADYDYEVVSLSAKDYMPLTAKRYENEDRYELYLKDEALSNLLDCGFSFKVTYRLPYDTNPRLEDLDGFNETLWKVKDKEAQEEARKWEEEAYKHPFDLIRPGHLR